jgi:hypothetical protein
MEPTGLYRGDVYRGEMDNHQPMTVARPGPSPQRVEPETVAQLGFNLCVGLNQAHAEQKAAKDAAALEDYRANRITEAGFNERCESSAFGDDGEVEQILSRITNTFAKRQEAASSRYDEVFEPLSAPGDAAEESRRTRYSSQVNRLFDAAQGVAPKTALAQRLTRENANNDGKLAVLLEELPTRLYDTSWPKLLEEVRPEIGRAAVEKTDETRISTVINYTVGRVRESIKQGQPLPRCVLDKLAEAVTRLDPDAKQAVT